MKDILWRKLPTEIDKTCKFRCGLVIMEGKMVKKQYSVLECFRNRDDLKKYKDDGLLLFAVELKYGIEDIDTLASESLTEGTDDKKTDLLYIDKERGIALIAQSYFNRSIRRRSAKANKASDLNTAISWLLNAPLEKIPSDLKSHADELRQVIKDRDINSLQIWYVHNLIESVNVKKELETVEYTAKTALSANYPASNVTIQAIEVGITTLEEWYRSLSVPILITDEYQFDILGGYPISGDNWEAFVTVIKGEWLYDQFVTHGTKLFSANVREYLGSRDKDDNINSGIKQSACTEPKNFWVYNNGITALVNDFKYMSNGKLKINGVSIVNGAQTTGALGSLNDKPSSEVSIPIRFVKSKDKNVIYNIVKYNNSQNKVAAPDFRSSDSTQSRLTTEFNALGGIKYRPRRGGCEDLIKRDPNTLPSVTAGQALAAFHQNPGVAYHKKTKIWESDTLYSKYFNRDYALENRKGGWESAI